jgi:hypothetical protein
LIPFQRPTPLPICVECLGTDKCNPVGEEEPLISCYGCGNSVHPSCRVYSVDLVHKFQREGWTCDDCKCCLICGESQTNVRSFSCSETDTLFAKLYIVRRAFHGIDFCPYYITIFNLTNYKSCLNMRPID